MNRAFNQQRGSSTLRYALAVVLGIAAVFLYLKFTAVPPESRPAETTDSRAAQEQPSTRPSTPQPKPEVPASAPRTPPRYVDFANDSLVVHATNKGARVLSIRLPGYGLTVNSTAEEKRDPKRCLELVHHSSSNVSAFSIFVQNSTYTDPTHPLRKLIGVLESADWEIEKIAADADHGEGVRWSLVADPIKFTKTFWLQKSGRVGEFTIQTEVLNDELEKSRDASASLQFFVVPAGWVFSDNDRFANDQYAAIGRRQEGRTTTVDSRLARGSARTMDATTPDWTDMAPLAPAAPDVAPEKYTFFADANKYFVGAMLPKDNFTRDAIIAARMMGINCLNYERKPEARAASVAWVKTKLPTKDAPRTLSFTTYFGPKEFDELAAVPELREIHNADRSSWMSPGWLSDGIAAMLRLFQHVFGNWGVTIIILTICLRAAIFPLTRRSQNTLAEFAAKQASIKPQLEVLTQKYKNNAKKLNEERLKLFKENKVPMAPPVAGCLPVFLNVPIFVGFFAALRTMFELRQQGIGLWIHDLSRPDEVFQFAQSFTLPVPLIGTMIGEVRGLNILPVFMIGMWIANQYVTQRNMPQSNDAQQKFTQRFTMILTVVMGLSLYNYASGLSVYSITSSTITLLEQTLIRKYWPPKSALKNPKK
ncbi:MAG: YidC/Oxa1 family insertase periplasmic-domain containing protein [Planctomycetes bacterium]|nr:YidC/Oxa1 family insertase periplasmic-domain containing protein [Planctomycetota bacterium]